MIEGKKKIDMSIAVCILTRRNGWNQRHLVRQTWLQDVPEGARVSHAFVIGEDKSFTEEENARLSHEVERYGDIILAPTEESYGTLAVKTKHCLYWATKNHDFDILIKTDDDSVLFLSRLVERWLVDVRRDDFVYFGKKHKPTKVANPANFALNEHVNTDKYFEFAYRGEHWPEFMQGGMYGFSRALAEEMVKTDLWTYTSEDATVGVWMSALRPQTMYLGRDHLLYREDDYQKAKGDQVLVTFQTDRLRLVSMWCEYEQTGKLSTHSILALDTHRALGCLRRYEEADKMPRSTPLAHGAALRAEIQAALAQQWPIRAPNLAETGAWWQNMEKAFRKRAVFVIGGSATKNRLPLYLLQGKHALVFDDFFSMTERFMSWSPTMYMCVDPVLCAARAPEINKFVRPLFASFFAFAGSEGIIYWEHLLQRVNVHWLFTEPGRHGLQASSLPDDRTVTNFHVSSVSGLATSVEILSFLGFSTIYIMAVEDEVAAQATELEAAARLTSDLYKTKIVHLYPEPEGKLPIKVFKQEPFMAMARRMHRGAADRNDNWDIEMFLANFPPIDQLDIARNASTVEGLFPRIARCRDYRRLNRFDPAVLCPLALSLKYFADFEASHVPHGPVRDHYVWLKR